MSPGVAAPYIMMGYESAFKNLGHEILILDLRPFFRLSSQDERLKYLVNLKEQVQFFSPDFALGYNIDTFIFLPSSTGGIHLFEDLKIPYISLFYDNPMIPGIRALVGSMLDSDLYTVFIWDRYYLKQFSQKYNKDAYYLPLASDPAIFFPRAPNESFNCSAGFIGSISSVTDFDEERKQKGWDQFSIAFARQVVETKKLNPDKTMEAIFNAIIDTLPYQTQTTLRDVMNQPEFDHFIHSVNGEIGSFMRFKTIQAIPSSVKTNLYGKEGWSKLAGINLNYKGKIDYHDEAPEVYSSSLINLNITSNQLEDSVNQRVFDVPACCGFLLTDHRPCLSELFEPDIEIVVYENLEDMREKILYYQNHERQRQTIAENAYKRFLNQHTYSHRAMQIILKLEENEKV